MTLPMTNNDGAGPSHTSLSTINAQLISHGWAKRPLNLDALKERDQADVVAVLFELIGAGVVSPSPSVLWQGPSLVRAD